MLCQQGHEIPGVLTVGLVSCEAVEITKYNSTIFCCVLYYGEHRRARLRLLINRNGWIEAMVQLRNLRNSDFVIYQRAPFKQGGLPTSLALVQGKIGLVERKW